ncbi:nucleotidyltransferase domain-containing protein [bacterium]|nr:nucleotidyltransferase domain-containing protein [bacterium]
MFGLEEKHLKYIKKVLEETFINEDAKFFIFGSRAKGTNLKYSDIDIAIKLNNNTVSLDVLGKLLIQFKDSTLPYEVDIVDLNNIDENFKNSIQNSLVEI